jgi:hypothetical protein
LTEIEIARRMLDHKIFDISEQFESVMLQRSIWMDGQEGSRQVTLHFLPYGLFVQYQNADIYQSQLKKNFSSSFVRGHNEDSFYPSSPTPRG